MYGNAENISTPLTLTNQPHNLIGRYGIIFDAGSSGTRLYVYRWKDPAKVLKDASPEDLRSLPKLKLEKSEKIRPGVSSFAERPAEIGPQHLKSLIDVALDVIPEDKISDTPVFLMATAGMRLLPRVQQRALLREICGYLQRNTQFSLPDCNAHIQVIPGETEGLYGWIATNYLLGGFDHPEKHKHGKGHHTYGFLDMGGASAQIAFAPNATEAEKHANDLKLLRMRTMDGAPSEYRVFSATWLGFGANRARERYVESLKDSYGNPEDHELPDPCMPEGLRTTLTGEPVSEGTASSDLVLLGTGSFDECVRKVYPLLGKDAPCEDHPCLLNGQHVPSIDFEVNHFIGVSEYWHTTHGVFGKGNKAYDLATYQKNVADFCSRPWEDIEVAVEARKKDKSRKVKDAQEACFKASWLINVLHDGIGIPRIGMETAPAPSLNISKGAIDKAKDKGFVDPFQPVDKIDGIEVSWTLGKMVLYAAGQIPPNGKELAVGFGSNVDGVPDDFEYAGSTWKPISHNDSEDDWSDKADDLLDHARSKSTSGIVVFIIILIFLFIFLRKRDRRTRVFGKFNSILRRHRRPGSPRKAGRGFSFASKLFGRSSATYERVMEEGEADQFELGDVDSDDTDHSDSSEGSRAGRSSGLATPKLNVERFDDGKVLSAMDRSGLVVRTESRERLVPSIQMLNVGRRSRAGSPTRLKSPLMTPLRED
jgi:golgi apyrase